MLVNIKRLIKNTTLNPCQSSLSKYAYKKNCCLNKLYIFVFNIYIYIYIYIYNIYIAFSIGDIAYVDISWNILDTVNSACYLFSEYCLFFIFIFIVLILFFFFHCSIPLFYLLNTNCNSTFTTLLRERNMYRVIWRDGEYSNNILRRNKFIMTI